MSDLWITASLDVDKQNQENLISAARVACAEQFGFVAQANSKQEFGDRMALVADHVGKTVNRIVASDVCNFPIVHAAVLQSWEEDFDLILSQKRQSNKAPKRKRKMTTASRHAVAEGEFPQQCPNCGEMGVVEYVAADAQGNNDGSWHGTPHCVECGYPFLNKKPIAVNTCRNCDRPTNSTYCSYACEDMDKLPAPRDIQRTLTTKGNRVAGKTAAKEEYFDPEFGGTLLDHLFETADYVKNLSGVFEYDHVVQRWIGGFDEESEKIFINKLAEAIRPLVEKYAVDLDELNGLAAEGSDDARYLLQAIKKIERTASKIKTGSITKQAWQPTIPQLKNAVNTPIPGNVGARDFDPKVLLRQMGNLNVGAISGGRWLPVQKSGKTIGVSLPVGPGYSVNVLLADNDTYTVQRVLNARVLGQLENIYLDEVGEVAYQASSYKTNEFGGHRPRMGSRKVAYRSWYAGSGQSPWGSVQMRADSSLYPGLFQVSTAGHGGMYVPDKYLHLIPVDVQQTMGERWSGSVNWYEEDDAMIAPLAYLPGLAEEWYDNPDHGQSHFMDRLRGLMGQGVTSSAINKKAGRVTAASVNWKYQQGYGFYANPVDFAYGIWARIDDTQPGRYSLKICAADGGEYWFDTVLYASSFLSMEAAAFAAQSWLTNYEKGRNVVSSSKHRRIAILWENGEDEPGESENSQVAYIDNEWGDTLHVWFDPYQKEWQWSASQGGPSVRRTLGGSAESAEAARAEAEEAYYGLGGSLDLDGSVWSRNSSRKTAGFWEDIAAQLNDAQSAKSAKDVLEIFPNVDPSMSNAPGFFAGSGGDDSLADALYEAGWKHVKGDSIYYVMQAPNGDKITYIEGDIYEGDQMGAESSRKVMAERMGKTAWEVADALSVQFPYGHDPSKMSEGRALDIVGKLIYGMTFDQYQQLLNMAYKKDSRGNTPEWGYLVINWNRDRRSPYHQFARESADRRFASGAFPNSHSVVYYNEEGEPLGWDNEEYDPDPYDEYERERFEDDLRSDNEWEDGYEYGEGDAKSNKFKLSVDRHGDFYHEFFGDSSLDWAKGYMEGWQTARGDSAQLNAFYKKLEQFDLLDAYRIPRIESVKKSRRRTAQNAPELFSSMDGNGDFSFTDWEDRLFYEAPETSNIGWVDDSELGLDDLSYDLSKDAGRRLARFRREAGENPFAKKDAQDESEDEEEFEEEVEEEDQPKQPLTQKTTDPKMMNVGDKAKMTYTMVDGNTGSIQVVFVRENSGVYFFNGPTGEFGIGNSSGQWMDADGNSFSFAKEGDESKSDAAQVKPKEMDARQDSERTARYRRGIPRRRAGQLRRIASVDPDLAAAARQLWGGYGAEDNPWSGPGAFVSDDGLTYSWINDTTLLSEMDGGEIKFREGGSTGWQYRNSSGVWTDLPMAKSPEEIEAEKQDRERRNRENQQRNWEKRRNEEQEMKRNSLHLSSIGGCGAGTLTDGYSTSPICTNCKQVQPR